MVSRLARGDFEDLQAQGLNPTLEDFDLLNQLAIPIESGAETTCANFPRVGWAEDVPFYQPTFAAFAWYHGYAARLADDDETANTIWWFALAHARSPGVFSALHTREEIERAVAEWVEGLTVTREEVMRAARYAVSGFAPAMGAHNGNPRCRSNRSAAAENLRRVEERIVAACAALKCPPDAIAGETPSRIDAICAAASVELGRRMSCDETAARARYGLALRGIVTRLRKEAQARASAAGGADDRADEKERGNDERDNVADSQGAPEPAVIAPEDVADKKPEDVVVAVHDRNLIKSNTEGQG